MCGRVAEPSPCCLTSPTTPTTRRQGPCGPFPIIAPIGSASGQYRPAIVSLMTATGCPSGPSSEPKTRPATGGMPIALK